MRGRPHLVASREGKRATEHTVSFDEILVIRPDFVLFFVGEL